MKFIHELRNLFIVSCSKLDQERIKGPLSPLRWSHSLKQPSLPGASVAGHVASLWSPHLIKSGFWNAENFCLWNPESRKNLLVESRILGFEIQNKTLGIGNPTSLRNAETKIWYPVPEIRTPWLGIQNPILSWIPLHGAKIGSLCMASKPGAVNILVNT